MVGAEGAWVPLAPFWLFWLFWLSLLPKISSLCSVNGTLLSIKANAENRVAILSLPLCEHVLHTMLLVLMWP